MGSAYVISKETRELKRSFDDVDAALLFAVRESLRLSGLSVEVLLSDGRHVFVWTQTL